MSEALETYGQTGNGGAAIIAAGETWAAEVTVEGTAPLLFHRWDVEGVATKAKAAKGSKAKKSDAVETYVYRNDAGEISIPAEYLRMSLIHAAKFHQDPRSPRKSAMDLVKAALLVTPELASLGTTEWDYLDRRRVMVQRNGITRERPAMKTGWRAALVIQSLLPEYVSAALLQELLVAAGRLVGIGDFRPTYGRFSVVGFEVLPSA